MARKEVDNIRLGLLKKFGSNAVMTGADYEKAQFGRISTGSIDLDLKLGGGIPIGRLTQISGAKSTAKSTLCDHIVKNAQSTVVEWTWVERKEAKGREQVEEHKRKVDGLICAYLDVEGTKTPDWTGGTIGVDLENWLYAQPSGLEETFEMAHQMQKDGVNLIVIDSIDALEPIKEYESEMGESVQMGLKPKMIGEYCRKFTATNNKLVREGELPCTVIFINQIREKIGIMYGSNEYTPGGRAIEFYASVDLRLRRGDWIVEGKGQDKEIVGQVVKFKTNKNKTYKQQQSGEFDFYFQDTALVGAGQIDNFKEVIIAGINYGVIERAGSWFKFNSQNLAQGADNTVVYFREHPEVFEQVKNELFDIVARETGGED